MNFLKYLFTVPEGEKVSDRHLKRVLISSVCSILLTMSCLFGTTWAWYIASVQVEMGPIVVSEHKAVVYKGGAQTPEEQAEVALQAENSVAVRVVFETDAVPKADDFSNENQTGYVPGRYIVLTVYKGLEDPDAETVQTLSYEGTFCMPATLVANGNGEGTWQISCTLTTNQDCTVYFQTAWKAPRNATLLPAEQTNVVLIQAQAVAEETATTEPSSEATTETTEANTTPVETTAAATESVQTQETTEKTN